MKKSYDQNQLGKIVCNLNANELIKRVHGVNFLKTANECAVVAEYPYHYLISVKYSTGLVPEQLNYLYTTISKASIFCGDVAIIKETGEKVTAYQKKE